MQSSMMPQLRSNHHPSNPQLRRVVKKLPSVGNIERSPRQPLQPSPLSNPAPLTARSLSTHLNQIQAAESTTTSVSGSYSYSPRQQQQQQEYGHSRARSLSQTNSDAMSSRRGSGGRKSFGMSGVSSVVGGMGVGVPLAGSIVGGVGGQFALQPVTIESLISKPPNGSLNDSLKDLRYLILTEGIPADNDGHSNLRIYVWSILLGVPPMRTSEYLNIVRRGPSPAYSKIRNDTFRTLATDPLFRRRVSEASLIRLLNAFANSLRDTGADGQYVQGMNVLAAPFLYAAKSEVEAFALFSTFIRRECPAYVKPTMEGVHRGLKLVDQCLETVDPKLYLHLKDKFLSAELYAFPSVLTLSACTPPLPEVLILWDFLLAYGAHLNILCVVAQLLLMRDDLLAAQSPMKLFRQFPPLQSKTIIKIAVSLVKRIPQPLFDAVVNHAR